MGAIRDALTIAGGGNVTGGSSVAVLPEVGPPGMVGTGPTIRDLVMSSVRAELTGWTWQSGDPSHPFEPHQELDGLEFDSWTSDVLANNEGWPSNPWLYPGDHEGCACSAPLRYRSRD
jgi:hypothetical protein